MPTTVSTDNQSSLGPDINEPPPTPKDVDSAVGTHCLDLGTYLEKEVSESEKLQLLKECFTPNKEYDFKKDAKEGCKRFFNVAFLDKYKWMAYSPCLQGALCKTCVLFKPNVRRGYVGAFIVTPFRKFKNIHEYAKNHATSEWHKESSVTAANFLSTMEGRQRDIFQQIDSSYAKKVSENRQKLVPILETIIFCGTHDLALRGHSSDTGNFHDLLIFRSQAGDFELQKHLESSMGNAKYTSHRSQNEMIDVCCRVIQKEIVTEVNETEGFSVLADETADISGKEQLSLGIRYVESSSRKIKEEFFGFKELEKLDAETISMAILNFLAELGLDMDKMIGLGFDGCSTMAGKESGVQQRIRAKFPKANFFHCASHRLNLVINDLCSVREIQNAAGSIKETIKFFRESVLRRKLVPNLPLFCETRWSAKYKSIRYFYESFEKIKIALEDLALNASNASTRTKAGQLNVTVSQPTFIIALTIMAKYSSKLEPVVNILQGVNINLQDVKDHMDVILKCFEAHRCQHEIYFEELFKEASNLAEKLGVDLAMPRIVQKQKHRSNPEAKSPVEYFRQVLFVPYLDSIISSISIRFSAKQSPAFFLELLHPKNVLNTERTVLMDRLSESQDLYKIENLTVEADTWFHLWKSKENVSLNEVSFHDCLTEAKFFPAVEKAILIYMTLPPTTCTVERTFSTLRRVKTWLRSTMIEKRLSGLCMMSVHRERIRSDEMYVQKVLDLFGQEPRRIAFAFSSEKD